MPIEAGVAAFDDSDSRSGRAANGLLAPAFYQVTPRPITDRPWWDAARARVGGHFMEGLRTFARSIPVEARAIQATDYLAAGRTNDRSLSDRRWQYDRRLVCLLALRLCLDGPERPLEDDPHDDRLINWLWSVMTDVSWCVVEHLPVKTLPAADDPILDLAACEMAAFIAELREVLLPWMVGVSPTLAPSMVYEIDRRVLMPLVADPERWGWNKADASRINNWTGVCGGSVLTATRSLQAQGFSRPDADRLAIVALGRFLERAFSADAECDEGVSYWCYGMHKLCNGLSRLARDEIEARVDLARLRAVAAYPGRAHLAGRTFWAANDSELRAWAPRGFVPWLAAATGDPFLAVWPGRDRHNFGTYSPDNWLQIAGEVHRTRHFSSMLRELHAPPEWCAPERSEPPAPPRGRLLRDQQAALFSRDHPRGRLSICMAGGHNEESHNHNDLGHVTVVLGETMLLPDLGAPHYAADFFGPRRYEYTVAGSQGHSCPQINGHEQRPGRDAAGTIEHFGTEGEFTLDLTAAYPPEAGLNHWQRKVIAPPAAGTSGTTAFTVVDEYELATSSAQATNGGVVIQRWWLSDAPTLGPDRAETQAVSLRMSPAPVEIRFVATTDEQLNLRCPSPQKVSYRVEAVYHASSLNIATEITVL